MLLAAGFALMVGSSMPQYHMSLLSLAYFMTLTPALLLAAILIKRSTHQQPGRILAVLVLMMTYLIMGMKTTGDMH